MKKATAFTLLSIFVAILLVAGGIQAQPSDSRFAIVDRGWELILRRETIGDRSGDKAALGESFA